MIASQTNTSLQLCRPLRLLIHTKHTPHFSRKLYPFVIRFRGSLLHRSGSVRSAKRTGDDNLLAVWRGPARKGRLLPLL